MQDKLETYLDNLRLYVSKGSKTKEEVVTLENTLLLKEHELGSALYALLCKQVGLSFPVPSFKQSASGAISLFEKGYYPWGALPYPCEHAELGTCLMGLDRRKEAEKIAKWQRTFCCDHQGKPIYSLFSQEKEGQRWKVLEEANKALFSLFHESIPLTLQAIDYELGLAISKTPESTVLCAATGCKSGMGCFLHQDAGIVNFGSQVLPLGEYEDFGLAGKPLYFKGNIKESGFSVQFQTRLAVAHPRKTAFSTIKDSGYSGLWLKAECFLEQEILTVSTELEGNGSLENRVFVFFGKGTSCVVAGSHKLYPRSLNRYQGPPQQIAFQGIEGKVFLEVIEGVKKMEVIPLAGDDACWHSDFLVVFTPLSINQKYKLYRCAELLKKNSL